MVRSEDLMCDMKPASSPLGDKMRRIGLRMKENAL